MYAVHCSRVVCVAGISEEGNEAREGGENVMQARGSTKPTEPALNIVSVGACPVGDLLASRLVGVQSNKAELVRLGSGPAVGPVQRKSWCVSVQTRKSKCRRSSKTRDGDSP